jgi:predicted ribosome quality control (RQC) complex YloA/Tae2 family protein
MRTITRYIECLKINVDFVVGTNAKENHDIIDAANPEDLWFHISEHPSCHVISKIQPGIEIDKKEMQKIAKQGAVVCKEMSGLKKEKNVKIDYTAIKYVTKGEKPGSVNITNAKQIII